MLTPSAYTNLDFDYEAVSKVIQTLSWDDMSQLIAWLKAREGCHEQFRLQLLLKYMKQMEYKVQIENLPATAVKGLARNDDVVVEKMLAFKLDNVCRDRIKITFCKQEQYDQLEREFQYFGATGDRTFVLIDHA